MAAEMASSSSSVIPAGAGSDGTGAAAAGRAATAAVPFGPALCFSRNSMCLDISAIRAWSCSSVAASSDTVTLGMVSPSLLQRHQAVLLGRTQFAFGVQILEDLRHVMARGGRVDDRMDPP